MGSRPDENSGPDGANEAGRDRLRLILVSALQVDKAVLFSALITVAGFVPLFTMQGVEGQIFGPMARTYGYALAGALIATFTITPVIASFLLPERVKEAETCCSCACTGLYNPALRFALTHRALVVGIELAISAIRQPVDAQPATGQIAVSAETIITRVPKVLLKACPFFTFVLPLRLFQPFTPIDKARVVPNRMGSFAGKWDGGRFKNGYSFTHRVFFPRMIYVTFAGKIGTRRERKDEEMEWKVRD